MLLLPLSFLKIPPYPAIFLRVLKRRVGAFTVACLSKEITQEHAYLRF